MSHSLKNFRDPLFLFRKIMFGLFFFPPIFGMIFVFFFLGKVYLYSLTRLKNVFFFSGYRKKKRVFHSLIRFLPKNPKKQTIPLKITPLILGIILILVILIYWINSQACFSIQMNSKTKTLQMVVRKFWICRNICSDCNIQRCNVLSDRLMHTVQL